MLLVRTANVQRPMKFTVSVGLGQGARWRRLEPLRTNRPAALRAESCRRLGIEPTCASASVLQPMGAQELPANECRHDTVDQEERSVCLTLDDPPLRAG